MVFYSRDTAHLTSRKLQPCLSSHDQSRSFTTSVGLGLICFCAMWKPLPWASVGWQLPAHWDEKPCRGGIAASIEQYLCHLSLYQVSSPLPALVPTLYDPSVSFDLQVEHTLTKRSQVWPSTCLIPFSRCVYRADQIYSGRTRNDRSHWPQMGPYMLTHLSPKFQIPALQVVFEAHSTLPFRRPRQVLSAA